ncbi:permease [Salinispira pacifica]
MTHVLEAVVHALRLSGIMAWDILWGLNLGFLFSAVVDVAVSKNEMGRLLPDSSPRSVGIACGLGAASSSCSYAAVAMARSIFRKGGDFTASMVFQFAATNLVIELGVLLAVIIGWQFTLAEFVGGPLMIALMVVLFRLLLKPAMVQRARQQAELGLRGSMEGHAGMATAEKSGTILKRIFSKDGFTSISHYFVMNWQMLWKDILGGLLIAGALGAWVPAGFWSSLFLTGHGVLSAVWSVLVGPLVAVLSFVCSIGNVPLALILWNGGIGFGGVVSFLFADLIIIPILDIYRRYYGKKMTAFMLAVFYAAMVVSAFVIDRIFEAIGLVPARGLSTVTLSIELNYTSILNIIFLAVALFMAVRFLTTGGPQMLRMMNSEDSSQNE